MALAMAVTWGLGIMLLGWISASGWGSRLVVSLSSLYLGFASTFVGGLIGGAWAFADAFVAGLVLTALYNAFAGEKRAEHIELFSHTEQPAH
jgi:NhaP-type Na+/H+ or K+/H+ antiporter